MAKSIGQKIIDKLAMSFVNEVSKRATKVVVDKGEAVLRKRVDKKNAARLDDDELEEEEMQ